MTTTGAGRARPGTGPVRSGTTATRSGGTATPSGPIPPARPGVRRRRRREATSALLFISPWIIGFLVFTLWPILQSAWLSMTDYDVLHAARWVGWDNYVELFRDPKVALSLGNTVLFTVLEVPAHVLVSLVLALLLARAGRASGFFRTVFFLPKMTPAVAVGALFLLVFNGQDGLVNRALALVGIDGPAWTTDPAWVKPGLVIMSLWTVGASVVIFLAALRAVPSDLLEAATLDGAGAWQRTLRVTLPLISPSIFFVTVVTTIASFQTFTESYTAFFGASSSAYGNDAALFYVIYLFQQGFEYLHMGFASAMAWVLFLIILAVTIVQIRVSRRLVHYEAGDA
ncbi:carbohydrate ABC transporter permease [Curtobacterium sp. L1-20]|uniref:carbohydrate ABC transporter permease n=1 Tax=Curtobacterium sp. L1-20 TaxID=3138181 RepID=UPI003B519A45